MSLKLIRPQRTEFLIDLIVNRIFLVNFWLGFIGWYQLFKWIKPYIGGI